MRSSVFRSAVAVLALSAAGLAVADEAPDEFADTSPQTLEEVRVYATPLNRTSGETGQPTSVLFGEALQRALAPTLGETLAGQPGINTSYFGPNVGRPVIRGLDGPRVRILEDGIVAADVSTSSGDHAVSVEPFLADQIEVLKGASTVLYGSGAIGGVVNTVTGRVPEAMPEDDFTLRAMGSLGDVADEETIGARADGRLGNLAVTAGFQSRETDNFDIPGFAESARQRDAEALEEEAEHGDEEEHDEEEEEEAFGTLPNSDIDTEAFNIGASYVGERMTIGLSVSQYETEYGLPGGREHEEGEEAEGEEEEEEEGDVRIDMEQTRYDFLAEFQAPFAGVERLRVRSAWVDYEHSEIEGNGEIGTLFDNDTFEARVELLNEPILGFQGAFGLQYDDREFSSLGEEAFVIPTDREAVALFAYQERQFENFRLDVGARYENIDYDPSVGQDTDFDAFSFSVGGIVPLSERVELTLRADIASRAPDIEELYSNGAHLATNAFEIGDASLDEEVARNLNATLHVHDERFDLVFSVFLTDFSDFTYLEGTGAEEDGLPVQRWVQGDARFSGAEFALDVPLLTDGQRLALRFTGDMVNAELDERSLDGSRNLPRIPASRLGVALDYARGPIEGELSLRRTFDQDDTASFELETDGFTSLDAHLGWHIDLDPSQIELYLRGRNLLDVEQRLHTSFIKDFAPLPGRALEAGVRVRF